MVTGSTAHGSPAPDLERLSQAVDTLVLLMAAWKLPETCEALIAAGRPPDEPAALVQWATTRDQKTILGTLAELPALASAANAGPPATLIVGEVAALPLEVKELAAQRMRVGSPKA